MTAGFRERYAYERGNARKATDNRIANAAALASASATTAVHTARRSRSSWQPPPSSDSGCALRLATGSLYKETFYTASLGAGTLPFAVGLASSRTRRAAGGGGGGGGGDSRKSIDLSSLISVQTRNIDRGNNRPMRGGGEERNSRAETTNSVLLRETGADWCFRLAIFFFFILKNLSNW